MTSTDPSAIGIMEGAFFVSKSELLDWLRTDLNIKISKVEECGAGVVYLQIMDRLFPGRVSARKLKYNAKQEWECLHNLKLLQSLFTELGIKKHIDIDRLAKCMYADNLEFLQWMKRFYDRQNGGVEALSDVSACNLRTRPRGPLGNLTGSSRVAHRLGRCAGGTSGSRLTDRDISSGRGLIAERMKPLSSCQLGGRQLRKDKNSWEEEIAILQVALEEKENEIEELREAVLNAEKESQFYFGKLRQLEVMAGEPNRETFTVTEIESVLFSEEGFPEEELLHVPREPRDTDESCGNNPSQDAVGGPAFKENLQCSSAVTTVAPSSACASTHGV